MGWTRINGVLPLKVLKTLKQNDDDIDYSDVHKDFAKTDVSKEMSQCKLHGIEKKRSIKVLSEREAARERKVNCERVFFDCFNHQSEIFEMTKCSTAESISWLIIHRKYDSACFISKCSSTR